MTTLTRRRAGRLDTHPDWCARGHRCNLGEHRAAPLTLAVPGLGRATLTRVRSDDGREHAEVTLTVALADAEPCARVQLLSLAADLKTLLGRATRASARPAA